MRTVLLVTAEWCAACKQMIPWWKTIKVDCVEFKVVNVVCSFISKVHITSLPTILFYEDDKLLMNISGVRTKEQVIQYTKSLWQEDWCGKNPI